ncbi:MAG: hypothetical protein L7T24_05385, partial [Luminiphilus sp.]|nr:hypothetical protein [Luminiphilus sp.]
MADRLLAYSSILMTVWSDPLPVDRHRPNRRGATPLPPAGQKPGRPHNVWMLGFALLGLLLLIMAREGPDERVTAEAEVAPAAQESEQISDGALPPAAMEAPVQEPEPPPWREERVREGDNLSLIFARA